MVNGNNHQVGGSGFPGRNGPQLGRPKLGQGPELFGDFTVPAQALGERLAKVSARAPVAESSCTAETLSRFIFCHAGHTRSLVNVASMKRVVLSAQNRLLEMAGWVKGNLRIGGPAQG